MKLLLVHWGAILYCHQSVTDFIEILTRAGDESLLPFFMKSFIFTGGIACGKSSAANAIAQHFGSRAVFFSADLEAQHWLDNHAVMDELVKKFGNEAVNVGGGSRRANRNVIRERVFGDPNARQILESILHPLVFAALESQHVEAEKSGVELFLAEVPLHYETGGSVVADLIIVLAASRAVQVRRLMERRGLNESIIEKMLRSQWPIEAKVERADIVIWNDGDVAAFEAQLLTLARQLWHDESDRNPRNP
ncbi:MAG: dephospho-CoA kinase [Prosthecobacter sp.]